MRSSINRRRLHAMSYCRTVLADPMVGVQTYGIRAWQMLFGNDFFVYK